MLEAPSVLTHLFFGPIAVAYTTFLCELLSGRVDDHALNEKVIIFELSRMNNQAISCLQAKYTDPRTKMRYADAEAFKFVRALPDVSVQAYLSLRNAAVVLK
jgi:hypothetical protein